MRIAFRPLALALLGLSGLTSPSLGQTLLGSDGSSMSAWEFTPAQANPCPQPTPLLANCAYNLPFCGTPGPSFAQPGTFLGDIADDPITDSFYLTDGFIIEQYTLDAPCATPLACAPLNAFLAPSFMGPLSGMGFDNSGGVVAPSGTPLLWLTDGMNIAAIAPGPPGSCAYTLVFGPCVPLIPGGGRMTDISWDPTTGTLWVCDAFGMVHNILPTPCTVLSSFSALAACGLTPGLTGIAYDGGTTPAPPTPPALPALWLTDGLSMGRVDITGAPAAPTFGAPNACFPTPAFLNGLALTQHSFGYGNPRIFARLDSYGQASTPGPTFGLEVYGAPTGANAWLILNYNVPGPGYLCPSVGGAGTKLWVDPTPPGSISNLGPLAGSCVALPAPVPGSLPIGAEAYAQIVFVPFGGPPAVDATNAIAVTFMQP
ncbi:MAG: hypothetical protein DRQ55_12775 [Planctomycetota bacterium]|nr:MAG: hypothetical protein DRQ55_12775 [Planctomycetota bacterium]